MTSVHGPHLTGGASPDGGARFAAWRLRESNRFERCHPGELRAGAWVTSPPLPSLSSPAHLVLLRVSWAFNEHFLTLRQTLERQPSLGARAGLTLPWAPAQASSSAQGCVISQADQDGQECSALSFSILGSKCSARAQQHLTSGVK